MMRDRVVRLVDADLRIRPAADLTTHHERDDARQVALVRQHLQVEHQLRVLVVACRHAGRLRDHRHRDVLRALRFGQLDPAFDVADRFQIVRQLRRGRCAPSRRCRLVVFSSTESRMLRSAAQPSRRARWRRSSRLRRTAARTRPAGCSPSAAAWWRCATRSCSCSRSCSRCRTSPRSRVLRAPARARPAGSAARAPWRRTDPSTRRRPAPNRTRLAATAVRNRVEAPACAPVLDDAVQPGDDQQLIAERLERLENRRELEAGALGRRASSTASSSRSARRPRPGGGPPWPRQPRAPPKAGTMLSRNGSAIAAPRRAASSRRDSAFFVMIMTPISSSGTARLRRCHERATTSGSRRPRRRGRSSARPAGRMPRAAARAHRSAAFRSRVVTNCWRRASRIARRPAGPSNVLPSRSAPDASIALSPSAVVRQRPIGVEILEREPQRIHRCVAARRTPGCGGAPRAARAPRRAVRSRPCRSASC